MVERPETVTLWEVPLLPLSNLPARLADGADPDGRQNNQPRCEVAKEGVGVQDVESVVDQRQQEHACQRPPDRALTAIDAGSAQYDGGDGLQFHPLSGRGLTKGHPACRDDRGQSGGKSRQSEGRDLDPVGADARQDRRLFIAPHRKHPPSEGGAGQKERQDQGEGDHDPDRIEDAQKPAPAQPDELVDPGRDQPPV